MTLNFMFLYLCSKHLQLLRRVRTGSRIATAKELHQGVRLTLTHLLTGSNVKLNDSHKPRQGQNI
jgi:hypothetical protein